MTILIITIIAIGIIIFIIIRDKTLKTNEVNIRAREAWFSYNGRLFYVCQYKKRRAVYWTYLYEYNKTENSIKPKAEKTPDYFNRFKHYMYSDFKRENERAKQDKAKADKKRKKNRLTIIK